ncbi:hypothetical protein PM082_020240 [Marasmius tenuissimus]|nr:hypothetical protein PM082_020240 [Marasmius tenuissimus]
MRYVDPGRGPRFNNSGTRQNINYGRDQNINHHGNQNINSGGQIAQAVGGAVNQNSAGRDLINNNNFYSTGVSAFEHLAPPESENLLSP